MPPKYKKVCPYCGETHEGYYPNNSICKCGAKYYAKTGTWLEREKKKENADVVEVVRCKDCKHLTVVNNESVYARCEKTGYIFWSFETDTREHFCAYGERREG